MLPISTFIIAIFVKFINTKGKLGEQKKFNMNLSSMTMLHSWLLFTLYNMLSDLSNSLPGYMCCVCSEADNQGSPFASQIMYSNEVFVHKLFSMNFTAMATQKSHCSLYLFSFYISELPFSKLRTSPSPLLFFFSKIYLFLAMVSLCCCTWAFSICNRQWLLFVVMRRLPLGVASPRASVVVACRL